ncbi:MAG: alpha/beta hydrolase [Actinobacteria bacterium]|nr:alpha/beta hydrolase [Actinomycetota bacterium]
MRTQCGYGDLSMMTRASAPSSAHTSTPFSRMVRTGNLSLHVLEWVPTQESNRKVVMLVHGLASNARLWDGAASALCAKGYRVFAVDQRGHGLSDKPSSGYDMATVVNDLATLIGTLQLDQPVVAGQSWGGNVVVELAHRNPEVVAGVCAVDGGLIQLADRFSDWESCAQILAPPLLAGTSASDFEQMIRRAYAGWPETAVRGTLANMEVLADGTIRPWLSRDRHMDVLRGLWEHRPLDIVPTLRKPVLFTPAAPEERRSFDNTRDYEQLATRHRHVRVELFAPAHHDLHAQFPERWADTLHRYVEEGFFV